MNENETTTAIDHEARFLNLFGDESDKVSSDDIAAHFNNGGKVYVLGEIPWEQVEQDRPGSINKVAALVSRGYAFRSKHGETSFKVKQTKREKADWAVALVKVGE